MLPSLKRVAAPLLALLLTAPLPAQEPNRNVRFGSGLAGAGRPTSGSPSPWSHPGHLAARPLRVVTRR
jgi:hypothetical protein